MLEIYIADFMSCACRWKDVQNAISDIFCIISDIRYERKCMAKPWSIQQLHCSRTIVFI